MPPELLAAIFSTLMMLVGIKLCQKGGYLKLHGKKTKAVICKIIISVRETLVACIIRY
jgi:hypothetical protein